MNNLIKVSEVADDDFGIWFRIPTKQVQIRKKINLRVLPKIRSDFKSFTTREIVLNSWVSTRVFTKLERKQMLFERQQKIAESVKKYIEEVGDPLKAKSLLKISPANRKKLTYTDKQGQTHVRTDF